jgi:hypothetical protein
MPLQSAIPISARERRGLCAVFVGELFAGRAVWARANANSGIYPFDCHPAHVAAAADAHTRPGYSDTHANRNAHAFFHTNQNRHTASQHNTYLWPQSYQYAHTYCYAHPQPHPNSHPHADDHVYPHAA